MYPIPQAALRPPDAADRSAGAEWLDVPEVERFEVAGGRRWGSVLGEKLDRQNELDNENEIVLRVMIMKA